MVDWSIGLKSAIGCERLKQGREMTLGEEDWNFCVDVNVYFFSRAVLGRQSCGEECFDDWEISRGDD